MRRSLLEGVILEALTGGGRRLFSETFHFCVCPRLAFFASSRSRWSSVADALPLCCSLGGCFAVVVIGWSSLWADALLSLLVGRWMLCHRVRIADLYSFGSVVFLAGLVVWVWLGSRVRVLLFCVAWCFLARVCVFSVFL